MIWSPAPIPLTLPLVGQKFRPLRSFSSWSVAVRNGPDTCRSVPKPGERTLPHSTNALSMPIAAIQPSPK